VAGFPKSFKGDAHTVNFRNVSLEDINKDGVQDIIFAAYNKLIAFSKGAILWEKPLIGTGIYPPSIADINGDGEKEIVQVTGGNFRKGRVYVVDSEGNNLPGFPKNYNDNWILTAPTLSDLDNDGTLEIIFLQRQSPGGNIHILNHLGAPFSEEWPIRLPGTPAVTPSVGDIDNDGEKDLIIASTTTLYAFDLVGQVKDGWPIINPDTKFSYQSPILADLDGDKDLEIIGATHGNIPEYYVYHHDGSPYKVWPFFVPENEWTYNTPTIVKIDNQQQILMSRPSRTEAVDMLYSWNDAGDLQTNFPLEKEGGLEGIISVGDIDNDGGMEIIFGSNLLDEEGYGFIHAFKIDGTGEVEGFPLRPKGWTLMNGAALGDTDGDGKLDLTALSYITSKGVFKKDSIFLNVYNLNVDYQADKILWSTYKGSNTRDGNLEKQLISSVKNPKLEGLKIKIMPNPIAEKGLIELNIENSMTLQAKIFGINGQLVHDLFNRPFNKGLHSFPLPTLSTGVYMLQLKNELNQQLNERLIYFQN
jgi:hypothetical protein